MTDNNGRITLGDVIDVSSFQNLMDSFSCLTSIPTGIIDLDGKVWAASGWQKICTEFHRKNEAAASRCLESDTVLAGNVACGERFTIYKCKNGLVDVAAPIYIESVRVGNLFIGQFLSKAPDLDFFIHQADEFGFDRDAYLEALSRVPVLSTERIERAVKFLTDLTVVIGNTGLANKKLMELNADLERHIQERTAELTYSNERLRVLSEASFEGVVLSEDEIVIEANDNTVEMFGYRNVDELIGTNVTNIIAPEKREDVENKIRCGYEKPYETLGLKKDGSIFPVGVYGKMFSYQGRRVRASAIRDLTEQKNAENEIQTLRGIFPICSFCKKIRDDEGYWEQVDIYIRNNSEADFSHSVCPECMKKHYGEIYETMMRKKKK